MADDQGVISIIRPAATAWRDAFAAFRQMPAVLGVAILASLAVGVVDVATIPRGPGKSIGVALGIWNYLLGLLGVLLVTPAAMAVHRFVLLGERSARYRIEFSNPRFLRFFVFAVLLQILLWIPGLFILVGGKASIWVSVPAIIVGYALLILAFITMLHTLILFPAVAVNAPGAEWGNALQDSKGHSWRLLFIVIFAGIPFFVFYYVQSLVSMNPSGQSLVGTGMLVVAEAVEHVLGIAVYAALASRLFLALTNRLGRPPGADGSLSQA
jgi:hypothetical protein